MAPRAAAPIAGALLLAMLGLLGARPAAGQNGTAACNPTSPNQAAIERLRSQLSSPTALVAAPSYQYTANLIPDGLSNGSSPYFVLPTPAFVVVPSTPEDVVAAVQFAADHCLKAAARGTGHQLAGLALAQGGVTIDMQKFQNISYDAATRMAYVQMGNPSGNVDNATLPFNQLPIAGTCSHVGVAGFTLHGGNGWASMWHGAAADFVQSLDVVVVGADGKAVRKNITAQSDPDLFFGFRGAGGNLGVALALTTVTFPTPDLVQSSFYVIDIDDAPAVLSWWAPFFAEAPVTIAPFVELKSADSEAGQDAVLEIGSFNVGPATNETLAFFTELDDYLRPRALVVVNNASSIVAETPYIEFANDVEDFCGDLSLATYWNTYYLPNGTLRTGDLPLDVIDVLVDQIKRANSSTASFSIEASPTLPSGEAASYFTPNAWSFRDAYQIFVGDSWARTPGVPPAEQDAEHIAWVREASAALKPFVVGNYINQLMMEDADDSSGSYEAGIFQRLQAVKAAADPLNLFRDLLYKHMQ